ncbi:MAG TPA: hypothetical protein V6D14_18355 [Coleofasciculaceae cyanobacterium]|jgi:hypothetical protein
MKFTAFFKGASIILAVALTPIAAAFELSSFTDKGEWGNKRNHSSDLISSSFLIAQQTRTQRIQFAPGAVGTVVDDSVVRGTRDIYLLRARKGQTMILNITSVEQNAVFDVQAPNGQFLQEESTRWSGVLPSTGDYSVIVSATRGNATYKLDVTIQ